MGWTFVASTYGAYTGSTSGTTLDAVATLNIAQGDLLVATGRYFDAVSRAITFAEDDGDNSLTMLSELANGSRRMYSGYVLVQNANATATIRMTVASGVQYRSFVVMQFRPDSGDTVTYEAGPGSATGTGTALATAAISTTGTDELVIALCQEGGAALSSLAIGGAAADGSIGGDALATAYSAAWYKIYTETKTDITGTCTIGASQAWSAQILAFKSVGAAGGLSIPVAMAQMGQFNGGMVR